jgi:hypothetical protein
MEKLTNRLVDEFAHVEVSEQLLEELTETNVADSLRKAKHGLELLQSLEPAKLTWRHKRDICELADRVRRASIMLVDEIIHDNGAI